MITTEQLEKLTYEYGGDWGLDHTKRLLHMVDILAEGLEYDKEIVTITAYIHDWGGYAPFAQPGVDHVELSVKAAREFLAQQNYPQDRAERVIECIACHHGGDATRPIESILFTDADALDLLGAVGLLRIFCMVPRSIRNAYAAAKKWRATCLAAITLDKTKRIAAERVEEMDAILKKFEEETFGIF